MVEENTKSKGHRWKLKLKQLIKISQPSADSHSCDAEARSEVFHGEEGEIGVGFKTWSTPMTIQIVDAKTHTDEMRPYTTYLIMAKQKEAGTCVLCVQVVYDCVSEYDCVCVCVRV